MYAWSGSWEQTPAGSCSPWDQWALQQLVCCVVCSGEEGAGMGIGGLGGAAGAMGALA